MRVKNAIIMAAGVSSRFMPLSYEKPKALLEVKGEVLVERQIKQLKRAGIHQIYIVVGYKAKQFEYLKNEFGVELVYNPDYLIRNNNASIWAVKKLLGNSFVCSSDNYFTNNPFEADVEDSYYAAKYAKGFTTEWCMREDAYGYINSVSIGGSNAWYMLGHTFWNEDFSQKFIEILMKEYNYPETADKLWEKIFMAHLDILKMKIKKYGDTEIFEFDTLDELRNFDKSYIKNSRSLILKLIAEKLNVLESEIHNIIPIKNNNNVIPAGFEFDCRETRYIYLHEAKKLSVKFKS